MTTWESIRKRSEDIREQLGQISNQLKVSIPAREIEERLAQVADLAAAFSDCQECDRSEWSPLEHSPLLTAKILFHLDRCEELLRDLDKPERGEERRSNEPEALLYPSLGEAILCRIFALLVYFRARFLRYDADYQAPTFREIFYLRSPSWLEPLTRMVLPRKRAEWSYHRKTDVSDH